MLDYMEEERLNQEIIKQAKVTGTAKLPDAPNEAAWQGIKLRGSNHYKARIEPIDLFRDMQPHESLSVLGVKALSDAIKYSYRMLTKGANVSDCDKAIHYLEMVKFMSEGK